MSHAQDGTDNMQLSSPPRRYQEGKNGEGRDCDAEQLVKTWRQWCQHLIAPEKGKATTRIMFVKWIPIEQALKNAFLEEWVFISDNPSGGPRFTTMLHDNETPAV